MKSCFQNQSHTKKPCLLLFVAFFINVLLFGSCLAEVSYTKVEKLKPGTDYEWTPLRQSVTTYLYSPEQSTQLLLLTQQKESEPRMPEASGVWVPFDESMLSTSASSDLWLVHKQRFVFSTAELPYDMITFRGVCHNPGEKDQLLFEMNQLGSSNGMVKDILFVFDAGKDRLSSRIVPAHLLTEQCALDLGLNSPANY